MLWHIAGLLILLKRLVLAERVAIVGGGVAGIWSYHTLVSKLDLNNHTVTLYEGEKELGGRVRSLSLVLPASERLNPDEIRIGEPQSVTNGTVIHVELGASVYTKGDKHLAEVVDTLGLETDTRSGPGDIGIWNGRDWDFRGGLYSLLASFPLDAAKFFYKSWQTARSLLDIYKIIDDESSLPRSPMDMFDMIGLKADLWSTTEIRGLSAAFLHNVVSPLTRSVYNQRSPHVFAQLTAFYASSRRAYSVRKGNDLVWDRLGRSASLRGGHLRLGKKLDTISGNRESGYKLDFGDGTSEWADIVILAFPLTGSSLRYSELSAAERIRDLSTRMLPKKVETGLIIGCVSSKYFNNPQKLPGVLFASESRVPFDVVSLETLPYLSPPGCEASTLTLVEYACADARSLEPLFDKVIWSYRNHWSHPYAFPVLNPLTPGEESQGWQLQDGLYWTGIMERFVSTMEAETISGDFVAKLVANDVELSSWMAMARPLDCSVCRRRRACPSVTAQANSFQSLTSNARSRSKN